MNRQITLARLALATIVVAVGTGFAAAADEHPLVGRWDISIGSQPSWIGIDWKDGKYVGRFLGTAGSVGKPEPVKLEDNAVEFRAHDYTWTGTLEGDTIKGVRVRGEGKKEKWEAQRFVRKIDVSGEWEIKLKNGSATLTLRQQGNSISGKWKGPRGETPIQEPELNGNVLKFKRGANQSATVTIEGDQLKGEVAGGRAGRNAGFTGQRAREWDKPIELFNGKDLDNWQNLDGSGNLGNWKVVDGIMTNTASGQNIKTKQKFQDFKMHVEFRVPEHGNSGVYLRGRHEIQVEDGFGGQVNEHMCGSLYSRIAPKENACKKPGEWQSYDITLIGSYVTVVQNEKLIIDNQEMEGITGGAIDSKEGEPGPIYLQGDHSAVEYRKVTLTPAKEIAAPPREGS